MNDEDGRARVVRFFEEQLPQVIAGQPSLFDAGGGVVSVFIDGAGGWTIRFGDHAAADVITPRPTLEADLIVTWRLDGFVHLLEGEADAPDVKPVSIGDLRLLKRLGSLMMPALGGGVGARLWGR